MAERGLLDKNAWLTLLDVCAVSGDMERTLAIFEEMKAEDCCDEVAEGRLRRLNSHWGNGILLALGMY